MLAAPGGGPRRIGVAGLGLGTVAAYGRPGDLFRFYEIDPDVEALARDTSMFTFLSQCPSIVEVVIGDARLSLERELRQGAGHGFDVLILDAFSSDAVPLHLLTREAFTVYRRHLAPGGILAAHTTNRHLDLAPVLFRQAREAGWQAVRHHYRPNRGEDGPATDWVLMTTGDDLLRRLPALADGIQPVDCSRTRLWTDAYSNLFFILKRR